MALGSPPHQCAVGYKVQGSRSFHWGFHYSPIPDNIYQKNDKIEGKLEGAFPLQKNPSPSLVREEDKGGRLLTNT